jgi:transcription initiation factor TFIID subunit 12
MTARSAAGEPALKKQKVMAPKRVQEIVAAIDPTLTLDPEVEQVCCLLRVCCDFQLVSSKVLLEIADDFVENVASFACSLAKHRKSNTLELKDVQLHLGANDVDCVL